MIENFKVGGLTKFGLDAVSLRAIHPRLVYCSISGFGQDGPYAERAGYDYMIQGMSGLMDITGEPEREPQKVGVAVVDLFTGVYASTAILAALRQRDRDGIGAHIDMALMDCAVAMLANQAMNYLDFRPLADAGSATPIPTSRPTRCSPSPTAMSSSRSATTGSFTASVARSAPKRPAPIPILPPTRCVSPTAPASPRR